MAPPRMCHQNLHTLIANNREISILPPKLVKIKYKSHLKYVELVLMSGYNCQKKQIKASTESGTTIILINLLSICTSK